MFFAIFKREAKSCGCVLESNYFWDISSSLGYNFWIRDCERGYHGCLTRLSNSIVSTGGSRPLENKRDKLSRILWKFSIFRKSFRVSVQFLQREYKDTCLLLCEGFFFERIQRLQRVYTRKKDLASVWKLNSTFKLKIPL